MVHEVIIPVVDQTTTSVILASWHVKEGAAIKRGEIICEIETEKATVQIEAPVDGIVRKIFIQPGTEIPPRTVVAIVAEAEDSVPNIDPFYLTSRAQLDPAPAVLDAESMSVPSGITARSAKSDKLLVSPRARRLAEDNGVELSVITPASTDGRIVENDIIRFLASASMTHVQRTSHAKADRVSRSWTTIPHFYMTITADLSGIMVAKKRTGHSVTLTDYFIFALGQALENHPALNGTWQSSGPVIVPELRIGLVVQTERGLLIPTLRDARRRTVEEIAVERASLVRQALSGTLNGDALAPSTFTVSNVGAGQIDFFTAIINPPQLAILSIGSVLPRPVVVGSLLEVRPTAGITLGVDHRAIDGRQSALFLDELKGHLETDKW